jgi:hypothetical protein
MVEELYQLDCLAFRSATVKAANNMENILRHWNRVNYTIAEDCSRPFFRILKCLKDSLKQLS